MTRLLWFLSLFLLCGMPVAGAEPQPGAVAVIHTPLKPDKFAAIYPGQQLQLTVKLVNAPIFGYQLRIAAVSDGRYMDVTAADPKPDEADRPTWSVAMSAPLGELVYQFLFTKPDGSVVSSERYVLRRPCLPNVELADIAPHPEIEGMDRLQKLDTESKNLEKDIASFDRVLELMGELQRKVPQR